MRRFWSYIFLAITALVTMGTIFPLFVTSSNSNIEYSNGHEIAFRLSSNDDAGALEVDEKGEAAKEIADIMAKRMEKANVSRFQIDIQGYDTIKVTFAEKSEEDYSNVAAFLSFNGSFALSSKINTEKLDEFKIVTSDEFLTSDKAYRGSKDVNGVTVPLFALPVNKDAIADVIEAAMNSPETSTSQDENGEEQSTSANYIYLWHNYNPDAPETFWNPEDPDGIGVATNYLLTKFDVTNEADRYLDGEDDNKLYGFNQNAVSEDPETKRKGYAQLDLMVNLLNAEKLNYKVTKMYENSLITPWVESISTTRDGVTSMTFNRTVMAALIAFVVLSLVFALYYKINAIALVVNVLLTVFLGYGAMVLLSAEYSSLAFIALIMIGIASIASSIIYLTKFKDECYRGRSIRKAHSDGFKKATLPMIDVSIIAPVIGIFCYIFGGVILRSFSVICVLGGLCGLLLNFTLFRGMTWLISNNTSFNGKYGIYGVDAEKVPDQIKEEKQTFFGEYAEKDFTKKKKPVKIVHLAVFGLTLIGAIVFSCIPNMNTYRQKDGTENTVLYFETQEDDYRAMSEDYLKENYLEKIFVYDTDASKAKSLSSLLSSFDSHEEAWVLYNSSELAVEDIKQNNYVIVVKLNTTVSEKTKAYWETYDPAILDNTIVDVFEANKAATDDELFLSVKNVKVSSTGQVNVGYIALGTGVAIAVLGLYFMLRYKLSRGLAAMILSATLATITIGLFSLLRLAVTNYCAAIAPVVAMFSLILCVVFMNKERELFLDDRNRSNDLTYREGLMIKANSLSYEPILLFAIVSLYIAINFFGFGARIFTWPFLLMAIMVIYSGIILTTINGPFSHWLFAKAGNIHLPERKHKKKANAQAKKSAEPEEAIFPGIND